METFCSNTVSLHLLLCCLDRASMPHIVEVDGTVWMQRGPLLDIQMFDYALKHALMQFPA